MSLILIVDDIPTNRKLLVEELTYRGFTVVEAGSGDEALRRIDGGDIDLVLLDVMMPGVSGLDVLREIRRTRSVAELPVILVTARAERRDIVQGLDLGANDYVTKPVDLPVITARVRTQLALRDANMQLARLNQQLRQAQEKIMQLTTAPPELQNVEGWAEVTAEELSQLIGTKVTVMLDGHAAELADDTDCRLLPIRGVSGQEYGDIVVQKSSWNEAERLLLESFCRELAAAMEMRRLRRELATAQSRLTMRRQELIEKGADPVQLCTRCRRCYDHKAELCEADGAPLDSAYLLPYRLRGRYRLLQRIATGGMAHLFSAADEKLGRSVAVKIIRAEQLSDPEMRLRFEQEARAIARIEHPGVSAIFDWGELEEGSMFFIMELLRGLNLAQMLHSYGRGTPRQIASMVRQIGATLGAVHRAGFIHRDVKPENIFLSEDKNGFRVKLLDFGIAKPIGKPTTLTQSGVFIGTPAYMAPEQVEGNQTDERTDVYSLAAVTYEALAGRRVTTEREVSKLFAEILHVVPAAMSSLLPIATADLDALFAQALHKDRAQRPESAEAWAAALASELDGLPPYGAGWPGQFSPTMSVPVKLDTVRQRLAT